MSESKRETRDSVFKLIFGEPVLLSQFLRDYSPLDILSDVEPEHIRDMSERFVSTISGNLDSDTVKEVARMPTPQNEFR